MGERVHTLEGADDFYRALVEQMPEGAAAVSPDGRILYANSCLARMLGVPLEGLVTRQLTDFVEGTDLDQLRDVLSVVDRTQTSDLSLRRSDGSRVPVAVSVGPVEGNEGTARCVVVVDQTRHQRAAVAVGEAEARFRGAFDNAAIGMALLDLQGNTEQVNPALCALAGRPAAQLLGRGLPWTLGPGEGIEAELAALLAGEEEKAVERSDELPDGGRMWVELHLTLVRGSDGTALHFIAQVQDSSARRRHEEQLQHLADHDGLTGLLNRRGFEQALSQHLALSARYGVGGALVLLDVDHFKYINDTRGHHVGDAVLIELAAAFRARLRESDVVARLGGDEFAILLPRGDMSSVSSVADSLVAAARAVAVDGLEGARGLSISAGVVAVPDTATTPRELLALADIAMYESKDTGRDRVTVYGESTGVRSVNGTRRTWLSRIEAAITGGLLTLEAQPIIHLATGETAHHELLVRLPGADGPISAHSWFPVAERYGLAPAIDEWVLDRAFTLMAEQTFPALNVNVSATSIGRSSWREAVREGLRRSRVDAGCVTFEVTETAAIGNIAAAVRFTEDVRAMGCRLALDDFGAGLGSFYYLKHLPLDDIKIDGEFVRDCVNSARDRAIIRAMVDIAGSLGRRTVAEGIENPDTLALVTSLGVDLAQGFHIGRPVPVLSSATRA